MNKGPAGPVIALDSAEPPLAGGIRQVLKLSSGGLGAGTALSLAGPDGEAKGVLPRVRCLFRPLGPLAVPERQSSSINRCHLLR